MTSFSKTAKGVLDSLDYGYSYRMSDYATSHEEEDRMEAEGLAAIAEALLALEEAHKASELATLQRIYNHDTWPEVETALELRIEELKGESL